MERKGGRKRKRWDPCPRAKRIPEAERFEIFSWNKIKKSTEMPENTWARLRESSIHQGASHAT